MPPPRLILASASPRRRELLAEAGYDFDVEAAGLDEAAAGRGVLPHRLPRALAEAKADVVAARHADEAVVVLAADTVAYTATEEVLGKPLDRDDAKRMLRALSNTSHAVVTGWAAIRIDDGRRLGGHVRSDVVMRDLSDRDLDHYLDTGEWRGKAGAYGVQDGPGGPDPFVLRIEGELTNVIGLPMPQVVEALAELGVERESA